MNTRRRRAIRWFGVAVVGASLLWGLTTAKATTRQGVNFEVSTLEIPLTLKAMDFLNRHAHYRRLAREITRGRHSDQERVLAVFQWTRQHIPPTPKELPVIDDHVWHIIIRGHGLSDQMADVFTTLSTYAGVPAFWKFVKVAPGGSIVTMSFAKVDDRWVAFDIAEGLVFADAQGRLIAIETLAADPALVKTVTGDRAPGGVPYGDYVKSLRPFTPPDVLRAEQQMPWPRAAFELRRLLRTSKRNAVIDAQLTSLGAVPAADIP